VLDIEARDAQREDAIRRTTTRSRQGSLAERQSFTSPAMHLRRPSQSSATSDMATTSGKSLNSFSWHILHQGRIGVDAAASLAIRNRQGRRIFRDKVLGYSTLASLDFLGCESGQRQRRNAPCAASIDLCTGSRKKLHCRQPHFSVICDGSKVQSACSLQQSQF